MKIEELQQGDLVEYCPNKSYIGEIIDINPDTGNIQIKLLYILDDYKWVYIDNNKVVPTIIDPNNDANNKIWPLQIFHFTLNKLGFKEDPNSKGVLGLENNHITKNRWTKTITYPFNGEIEILHTQNEDEGKTYTGWNLKIINKSHDQEVVKTYDKIISIHQIQHILKEIQSL